MDNTTAQKIKDAITKSKNIGIVVGSDPSLDQMAAALSLNLFLKQTNKKVTVACPTDPLVEISSLVGINKVQKSLGGEAGDLVVSFPYLEGEIEKVSYTLEEGFLNIIVKASEQGLSFDEKDVKYTRGSGTVDLLIVIGTPSLSDLGDVFDTEKFRNTRVINIDNKEENQRYGDIVIVSPDVSSLSEQIADIALVLGFQIDQDAAQNLLSGIASATKNFQDPATSSLAFEMAALLMKKGAKRVRGRDEKPERREEQSQLPSYSQRLQQARQAHAKPSPQRDEERQKSLRAAQIDENEVDDQQDDEKPPVDWLAPKVYKGSSNF
jgi:nanoRNase/pAp phosphatase (c-di-AMP/oligoRNAs hydrolase)